MADILLCRSGGNRTYKHTPVHKVGGKTKFDKRVANKKIRRSGKDNLENAYSCKSNDYRKENESWHICFFSFLHSSPTIAYNIYSLLGQLDLDMLLLKSQNLELTDIPLFFW